MHIQEELYLSRAKLWAKYEFDCAQWFNDLMILAPYLM